MSPSEANLFVALYEEYQRHVYAYCRRRVPVDVVDDVVADVFLSAWRRIGESPRGEDILAWLYRIAFGAISNHRRGSSRRKRLESKLESLGVTSGISIPDQIVVREEVREAVKLLDQLSDSDREVLKLFLWEELPHREIGTVLGIDENAARQRLHRAKKRLVSAYEKRQPKVSPAPAAQKGGER